MEWLVVWFEQHPGTASWAQAVGTIIALVIALAVPFQQNRMMRKEASIRSHEQAIQLFDALGAIADFAEERLRSVHTAITGDTWYEVLMREYHPDALASVANELENYPVYQLPDHQSVATALQIKACFARAWAAVNTAAGALKAGDIPAHEDAVTTFRIELEEYGELVQSFGFQATEYRERIGKA
ncbi:hypothetical protein [Stutzerimonas stutzeri]|uniref:hypothetical protein n=1 Tax=Stutzerimonas stutzeri TaxID=316 RepID=UPI0007756B42|nr:hypothetical protein [Stutzerimonas stutzeri]KXO81134.1 hypothetical protein AYK87_13290 [Stutzerimonas stutzeri]